MGVPGGVLGGFEISQYLVFKHFLSWPETVLFLNDIFWYLYMIYKRQIDFILWMCLFHHYLKTFLILSKKFHIIFHFFYLSFTKVVFVIVILQKTLSTKFFSWTLFFWLYVLRKQWTKQFNNKFVHTTKSGLHYSSISY